MNSMLDLMEDDSAPNYHSPHYPNIISAKYNFPNKPKCEEVYEMEEIIGEGNFSDVVCAVHNTNKQRVAIKIIDKNRIDNAKKRDRLQNEVRLHKRVKHPNIVQFIEPYESELDVCLVMELCEGGELFNRIVEKGKFSEKEACRVITELVSAVQFLHSIGIVHRDIKPENILYKTKDHQSEIKLTDFGLAKKLSGDGREALKASFSGTTAYCAPERFVEDQESKAVDLWSIGCIMYFLLYGVPPFYSNKENEKEYDDEIVESVLENDVKFPEGTKVSDLAKDLIIQLLEKDPTKRIGAEQVLQHTWVKVYYCCDQILSKPSPMTLESKERAFLKSSFNKLIERESEREDEMNVR